MSDDVTDFATLGPYDVLEVEWTDPCSYRGWNSSGDINDARRGVSLLDRNRTVGYFLRLETDALILCRDTTAPDAAGTREVLALNRPAIVRVRILERRTDCPA